MNQASQTTEQAHALDEGGFGDFELSGGFTSDGKFTACFPHQISQANEQCRRSNVNQRLLDSSSPRRQEGVQGIEHHVFTPERDQWQRRKNNHDHQQLGQLQGASD